MQGVCPKSPDQNTAGPGGGIKAPLFFFCHSCNTWSLPGQELNPLK